MRERACVRACIRMISVYVFVSVLLSLAMVARTILTCSKDTYLGAPHPMQLRERTPIQGRGGSLVNVGACIELIHIHTVLEWETGVLGGLGRSSACMCIQGTCISLCLGVGVCVCVWVCECGWIVHSPAMIRSCHIFSVGFPSVSHSFADILCSVKLLKNRLDRNTDFALLQTLPKSPCKKNNHSPNGISNANMSTKNIHKLYPPDSPQLWFTSLPYIIELIKFDSIEYGDMFRTS